MNTLNPRLSRDFCRYTLYNDPNVERDKRKETTNRMKEDLKMERIKEGGKE
jgi:hypothetical protein